MSEIEDSSGTAGPPEPRTAAGRFLAHRSVIIIKETREIGALKCEEGKKVSAETITLATARGGKIPLGKTFGIRLEAPLDDGGTQSALIDLEEIQEFSDALQFLHDAAQHLATLKTDHTEATFSTKDGVRVGFYQSTEQRQLAFIRLSDREDTCFFQVPTLLSLRRLIEAARSYLALKGAGGPAPDRPEATP